MGESGHLLLVWGAFLLVGFVAHYVGRRTHVPRVTLLLVLGVLTGPAVLDLVPHGVSEWFPTVSRVALSMVGFILGHQFEWRSLRRTGTSVLVVSLVEALLSAVAVALALVAAGTDLALALLFAAGAPATAPAATLDVIRGARARGPVTDLVSRVVAIDDAWGVLLFSVLIVVVQTLHGGSFDGGLLLHGLWEVGGGLLVGALLGLPVAWLGGRVVEGQLTLVEMLGAVLLVAGLAELLGFSHLLASMAMGTVVANRPRHDPAFHAIEDASQPFLIVFFLLAGYELDLVMLRSVPLIGVVYVLARAAGKLGGATLGARLAGLGRAERRYAGWCLLPQAGVALGLGLALAERFPELGRGLLSTLVATTIAFELVGPSSTQLALARAGESGLAPDPAPDPDEA